MDPTTWVDLATPQPVFSIKRCASTRVWGSPPWAWPSRRTQHHALPLGSSRVQLSIPSQLSFSVWVSFRFFISSLSPCEGHFISPRGADGADPTGVNVLTLICGLFPLLELTSSPQLKTNSIPASATPCPESAPPNSAFYSQYSDGDRYSCCPQRGQEKAICCRPDNWWSDGQTPGFQGMPLLSGEKGQM